MNALEWAGAAGVIAVLGYGGFAAYDHLKKPVPVGSVSVPAVEAPAVKRAPKVKVAIKAPVTTLQGDSKVNLKLPGYMLDSPDWQVLSAQQTPSNVRPTTQTTAINTTTGEVQNFTKTDPYPWIAFEPRGEIGLAYGYKYSSTTHAPAQVGRLQFSYDAVRVKALTIGVTATLDTDRDAFAGVAIKYKW